MKELKMKIPSLKTKDLLSVSDLSREEILELFKFSAKLKKDLKKGKPKKYLKDKSLAMIFEKNSTRTRVSFETGIFQLGGSGLYLNSSDIQLGRGETFADTARVMSRYVDGIMVRTDDHNKVLELAENGTIPVINGLTDTFHPCQTLTDYFTIYERDRDLTKIKLAYIGDGNNMANSLITGAAILGINIAVATPKSYSPDQEIVDNAYKLSSVSGAEIIITTDIEEAVNKADYLYTDVWASMGQEKEAARRKKAFAKYKISMDLLKKCPDHCRILHCLPAHRGDEIDSDAMDSEQSIVFDQAENRLHVQKAIMCALMSKKYN